MRIAFLEKHDEEIGKATLMDGFAALCEFSLPCVDGVYDL